jgi:hypothetical protein
LPLGAKIPKRPAPEVEAIGQPFSTDSQKNPHPGVPLRPIAGKIVFNNRQRFSYPLPLLPGSELF